MATIEIRDENVTYVIEGECIAGPVSTRLDNRGRVRARWYEARIYRKADGTYVFYQVNYSRVWHLPGAAGHIRKPSPLPGRELPPDAVYCGLLPPRDGREQCPALTPDQVRGMDVPDRVLTEFPQYRLWSCPTAAAVIERMTIARHRFDGVRSAAISGPMRELLTQAAQNDPGFRDGDRPVVVM